MLRILLTLVAANLLAFLWIRGSFDSLLAGARDPDRLNQQVEADRLRVAAADRAANTAGAKPSARPAPGAASSTPAGAGGPAGATAGVGAPVQPANPAAAGNNPGATPAGGSATGAPAGGSPASGAPSEPVNATTIPSGGLAARGDLSLLACSEFGPLDDSKLIRARNFFNEHAAYFMSEVEPVEDPPLFLVYALASESMQQAQRKLLDFKRQGFEGIAIINEGQYRLSMSFGTFRTEEAAKAVVENLTRRGVRNLKIAGRDLSNSKSMIRYRYQAGDQGPPKEISDKLIALGGELGVTPNLCPARSTRYRQN